MTIDSFKKMSTFLIFLLAAVSAFLIMPAKGFSQENDLADTDEFNVSSEICPDFYSSQNGTYNNEVTINQTGEFCSMVSNQDGSHNLIIATQSGHDNNVTISQNGEGSISVITQNGTGNFIKAAQNVGGNFLSVEQSGSDNSLICIQNGSGISGVIQTGGARAVIVTEK